MKHLSVGILAHVDAGKTTLSESILYHAGAIRTQGRVDKRDTFLDTHEIERERGITVFSKQAEFQMGERIYQLLDTPGHMDFSLEAERSLWVMDYAILVISGSDGVQAHTRTLWKLLQEYRIPVFLFVNKMDIAHATREEILSNLREGLSDGINDFTGATDPACNEAVAMSSEELLSEYLEKGCVCQESLCRAIAQRELFPCMFGSALKDQGVSELLETFCRYTKGLDYGNDFGGRIFKITTDRQGVKEYHLKVTGGTLRARDQFDGHGKVNQIRYYQGAKFELLGEAAAGVVCAVTGLTDLVAGDGLGAETESFSTKLSPVITYRLQFQEFTDSKSVFPQIQAIGEEIPELAVRYNEIQGEIEVSIMGDVQSEVLLRLIQDRLNLHGMLDRGSVCYKETITDPVMGYGHFEPLRHYAEVHLLLEPGEPGSGITFESRCREEYLDKSPQKQIFHGLSTADLRGVLTGAALTDVHIVLMNGRAHEKHTEAGDFSEAARRAVRQGLCKTTSRLLEPYSAYRIEIPSTLAGKVLYDLDAMKGSMDAPLTFGDRTCITGRAPWLCIGDYQKELLAASGGEGLIELVPDGYGPCHNESQVLAEKNYDRDADVRHPSGSVFCSHGAGYYVEWDAVEAHLHVEIPGESKQGSQTESVRGGFFSQESIGEDEIQQILQKTAYANVKDGGTRMNKKKPEVIHGTTRSYVQQGSPYLLVDGYNVIFAWEELKALAETSLDAARGRLQDILSDYRGITDAEIIVVYDAYKVAGGQQKQETYHNIHLVFTAEAETADRYIERFAHRNQGKYNITVATSDGVEQVIIRGQGAALVSSRELKTIIESGIGTHIAEFREHNRVSKAYLADLFTEKTDTDQ